MELINRENKEVIDYAKTNSLCLFTIRDYRVLFITHAAVNEFGLIAGRFMHLFHEEGRWFFFTNTSPTGFPMYRSHVDRSNSGFHVFSAAVVNILLGKSTAKVKDSFVIKRTDRQHEGADVFEIDISKPIKNRR